MKPNRRFRWIAAGLLLVVALVTLSPATASARRRKQRPPGPTRTGRILTERNDGQKLFVTAGDLFWVRLKEHAVRVGVWELQPIEGEAVIKIRETVDYKKTWTLRWFKEVRKGGFHLFTFQAKKPGLSLLTVKMTPFDARKKVVHWRATIIVTPRKSAENPKAAETLEMPAEAITAPVLTPKGPAEAGETKEDDGTAK